MASRIKDPGNSGENILWDYSSLKIVDDNYKIRYRENETDTAGYVENAHNTSYYYRITRDSLFLYKYVNGTTRMIYTLPELKLTYPFNYKDSINSPLAAKGNYCGKLPLHISGNSETTADAFGKLITPEGDVLRLHNKTIYNKPIPTNILYKNKLIHGLPEGIGILYSKQYKLKSYTLPAKTYITHLSIFLRKKMQI